ncbi:MAG: hypothetical protein IKR27_09225 [Lachnospiraceae bacterium]|nr:hypothetical protein [Lachnospiraceae bacterium]
MKKKIFMTAAVLSCTLGLLAACGSEKSSSSSVSESTETVDIKTGNEENSSAESSSVANTSSDKDSSESRSSSSDKEEQPEIIDVGVKPGESSSAKDESSQATEKDSSSKESESSSGKDDKPADGSFSEADLYVTLNGNRLTGGDDFLTYVDKMGKKARIEEGQACLEGGYDTNYYYDPDLTVYTIAKGGKQLIYDIYITGEAFPNDRGVTVGKTTREEIGRLYGEPSSEHPAADDYVNGKNTLSFEYENDVVSGITYSYGLE